MDKERRIIQTSKKTTKCIEKPEKAPKNRVITQDKRWVLQSEDYNPAIQWDCLFVTNNENHTPHQERIYLLAKQQIMSKIYGYRCQDIKNGMLQSCDFVDLESVMSLLKESEMKCFYCKEMVKVLYEHVREPCQWTLDRINNNTGHTKTNVMIACLNCNLRRRCMYHERYLFTKQLVVVKKET